MGRKLLDLVNRLFRLERGEWPRLIQFGLFGFLLQMGMGVGFSAGDAAFLSNVGADRLPLVFMLTPAVMLLYTVLFSYLLVRFSIDRMVDLTLAALVAGGVAFWALIDAGLPPQWQVPLYFAVKLYLAMWYIALYSLFWNYTDAYFAIQDAKRLFPLFAAFCALGTACGAMLVSVLAERVAVQDFFLLWAAIALATAPLAVLLRRRWSQIAESDSDLDEETGDALSQLAAVGRAFGRSRYTMVFTLVLFVTLLMTNLAEYQYSMVLQEGRDEAALASLFGTLYAAANLFNLVTCLFVFNRLVARLGVRNVAFIQPLTYFAVFGWFFLQGGTGAALAAFFAYHGVLTSIEYNNQNLLFNAVPSQVKRPLRTVMEGMAEPLASLVSGGFLIYAASQVDMRELSGIGIIVGATLIAVVVALRQLYPSAMTANMRKGWMNFGDRSVLAPQFEPEAKALLAKAAAGEGEEAQIAARLLDADTARSPLPPDGSDIDALLARLAQDDPTQRIGVTEAIDRLATPEDVHIVPALARCLPRLHRDERRRMIRLLGRIGDSETIPDILEAAAELAPRARRAIATMLTGLGETAIPRLLGGLRDRALPYRSRAIAARALAQNSYAQFAANLDRLVIGELDEASRLNHAASLLDVHGRTHRSIALLARAQRERAEAAIDFVLELLAVGGLLPNFDLLIVSLHSANPKVRGNAVEAIESSIDRQYLCRLGPLLHGETQIPQAAARDLDQILGQALGGGQPLEMILAADVLHARLDGGTFIQKLQDVILSGIPEAVRCHVLGIMQIDGAVQPHALDLLAALADHPEVGGATLEALGAAAQGATFERPESRALAAMAGGTPFWIAYRDLGEVAARFPELALVLLKSQDDRQYAA
ncbi:ATP/ADP translocase [Novosphingobium mathurense]|uniref:ATP/ADP translocase n=1 Tax=Novosphingobium mathurense TaxID=428990 RepID=A0A1U6GTS5_9SPHN|nr:ATP/ADP translocase [Novosphingobium mathurense]